MKEKKSELIGEKLIKELEKKKNFFQAQTTASFFKTQKGAYGFGDIFWGVTTPQSEAIVKKFWQVISLAETEKLLDHPVHEVRSTALRVLVKKYQKGNAIEKKEVVKSYQRKIGRINNWDLVDLSAPKILGDYFFSRDKKFLYQLAKSKNLWRRRIAIVSTLEFIRRKNFTDTLRLAELLLSDPADLVNKAVGWMLREVGKCNKEILQNFLKKNKEKMVRITWRYATEKFSSKEKKALEQR